MAVLWWCCRLWCWSWSSKLLMWFLRNPCSVCWVMRMSFSFRHKTSVLSALSATVALFCSSYSSFSQCDWVNFKKYCTCNILTKLIPPLKWHYLEITMHSFYFLSRERVKTLQRECPTCEEKRKEGKGKMCYELDKGSR